jgi:hypothetical protein
MHIIFGDAINEIPNSFTILQLDTFKLDNKKVTAYCVVEKIPLSEFIMISANKELHENLINYYQKQQWNYCEQAIAALTGKWNGELDTFYIDLLTRINQLKHNELDANWDGSIEK